LTQIKTVARIEDLIVPVLEANQVELVDLEYRKQDGEQIIRIYIDSPAGVDLDLCGRCTMLVRDSIDACQDISYDRIEVSSPGLDRVIKKEQDFIRFKEHRVKVKTRQVLNGSKNFIGILKATTSEYLNLEADGQLISLPREAVTMVRLHPDF
jgi:ribosome maturation factor RimP